MKKRSLLAPFLSAAIAAGSAAEVRGAGLESVETIVVIYAENRSFDNLYGFFPGASGLSQLTAAEYTQRDRDGSVLKGLPPVWGGLTEKGAVPVVTQAQTEHLPNAPFAIDDPKGFHLASLPAICGIASTRIRCRSQAARMIALPPMPMREGSSWGITPTARYRSGVSQGDLLLRTISSWGHSAGLF